MATPLMKRLMREAQQMTKAPVREYHAYPLEDNMLEWHFTLRGPDDSPFAGGLYHGRITVPPNYPFSPPDVFLLTRNGRFEVEKKICLSITSYHPENWQSTWGMATLLTALRDFMLTPGTSGIGALEFPAAVRQKLAIESRDFVCPHCKQAIADHAATMDASPPAAADAVAVPPSTPLQGAVAAAAPSPSGGSPSGAPPVPPSPFAATPAPGATPPPMPSQQPEPEQGGTRDVTTTASPLEAPAAQASATAHAATAAPGAPAPAVAPAPAPAAAVAVAPAARPQHAAVEVVRRGLHVEVNLSAHAIDRMLWCVTLIALAILLKKFTLDAPRSHTEFGQNCRWVIDMFSSLFAVADDTFPDS